MQLRVSPRASQLFMTSPVICLKKKMAPGGRSPNWNVFLSLCSVQTAVINVFKGGGLQSNELYALNENIRYLTGQNQCCFPIRRLRVPLPRLPLPLSYLALACWKTVLVSVVLRPLPSRLLIQVQCLCSCVLCTLCWGYRLIDRS